MTALMDAFVAYEKANNQAWKEDGLLDAREFPTKKHTDYSRELFKTSDRLRSEFVALIAAIPAIPATQSEVVR